MEAIKAIWPLLAFVLIWVGGGIVWAVIQQHQEDKENAEVEQELIDEYQEKHGSKDDEK